jgi:hypothetical protein
MAPRDSEDDFEDEDLHDEGQENGDGGDQDEGEAGGEESPADDEGQADGEASSEGQVRPEPRQVSRGERRFQRMSEDVREQRSRADKLERELADIRADRDRQQRETQQREPTKEEMALWTPEERMDYRMSRAERHFNNVLSQTQAQTQDVADKAAFDAKAEGNPRYKRYADEVERRLVDLRKQGQSAPREAILKFILGERLLTNNGGKSEQRQRQNGQRRIARASGGQQSPRGDAGGGRQALTEAEKRLKRLEDVTF